MIPPRLRVAALLVLCAVCAVPFARAGGQTPASFLLYPEFDTRPGQATLLTLTNVNTDSQNGSIDVHVVYVDAATCLQSDLLFHLSAGDTVTFLANVHVPAGRQGYVWAVALDHVTHRAIRFDWLIGDLFRLDGFASMAWSVQPLGFLGKTAPGASTDVNNNGKPDLDGIEYERAPNRFFVPRFFGQHPDPAPRGDNVSDLILLQPLAAPGVTTTTAFLIWNDNEEVFSGAYAFTCWKRVRLLSISGVFSQAFLAQSNQNPSEVIGIPSVEEGWFQVRGATATSSSGQVTPNPPVFGVMVDVQPSTAADLPFIEANSSS
jgi:hypothetical protein